MTECCILIELTVFTVEYIAVSYQLLRLPACIPRIHTTVVSASFSIVQWF